VEAAEEDEVEPAEEFEDEALESVAKVVSGALMLGEFSFE